MSFFENSFLWRDAVIAAAVSAAAVASVGVHATLRRVVFLPAALSQLAGLGVVAAFLVAHFAPDLSSSAWSNPRLFAVIFSSAGALSLGFVRERRGLTREWALGSVFISSSALILILGGHITQELHDVNDILFGNAIAIEPEQMWTAALISGVVLVLHGLFARPFMAIAFDAQTARAHGVPVRTLDGLLFISMGLAVATSTKVTGALPAFAFAVFPAAAALRAARDPRIIVFVAALLGALDAFLGYFASFVLSLPTGACMALAALLLFVPVAWFGRLAPAFWQSRESGPAGR